MKQRSPSAGNIIDKKDYNPVEIAKIYNNNKATCLSVLTEESYFSGNMIHIKWIKEGGIKLPILCKDFFVHKWQLYYAKSEGADAILIIMSILSLSQAKELLDVAKKYKIDCLVEVHDIKEINNALKLNNPTIGINNRNLKNLEVNLINTIELYKEVPDNYTIVAESGIKTKSDIDQYN